MIEIKKLLAVSIIILFIGIAVAPSINQSVVTASQDDDLIEVTTQACGIESYMSNRLKFIKGQIYETEPPLDLQINWENDTLTLTAILENDSALYVEFLVYGELFFTDTEPPFEYILPMTKMMNGIRFGVRAYWFDGNSSTVEYWIAYVKGFAVNAAITNESVSLFAIALRVSYDLFWQDKYFFERVELPWQYWGEIGKFYVDAYFSFPYEQAHGEHYDISIGTGMNRFHEHFGIGYNISVYNTGDQVLTGVMYANLTPLFGEPVPLLNDSMQFSLPPGWGAGMGGWSLGFPLRYSLFRIELTVIIGNMIYSKSGYEIGPFVFLILQE